MSRSTCAIAIGSLIALASVSSVGCGTGRNSSDVIVASVAGAPIGSNLLKHWTSVELVGSDRAQTAARRRALDLLISWAWTAAEARALRVSVTAPEAGKQLPLSQVDQSSSLDFEWFRGERLVKRLLGNPRISQSDQLRLLAMAMLASRVAQRHAELAEAKVPRAAIVAYYQHHRGQFRIGERRDIKAIVNWSKAKVIEAMREMQAGVRFHTIEERFNQTVEGGLRLGRARGSQAKRYEKDYFAAPPHVLVGPLKEILYYVFEVVRIRPGFQRTLAEAEPAIRRRLAAPGAGAVANAYERRWRERTVCQAGFVASRCGAYRSQFD
jgi:hypothetical protein